MDRRNYDTCVYQKVCSLYPEATILFNQKVPGRYSRANRQCDILVQESLSGPNILFDAKYRYRRTDIQHVKEFISLIGDIGCDTGVLVASKGYTDDALSEAKQGSHVFDLELVSFEELEHCYKAITYQISGKLALELRSPLGWTYEPQIDPYGAMVFYPKEYYRAEASGKLEFLSLHNWYPSDGQTIDALIEQQSQVVREKYPGDILIHYEKTAAFSGEAIVRFVRIETLEAFEITAYLSIGKAAVYFSMFTPSNMMLRSLSKLKRVVANARLIEKTTADASHCT